MSISIPVIPPQRKCIPKLLYSAYDNRKCAMSTSSIWLVKYSCFYTRILHELSFSKEAALLHVLLRLSGLISSSPHTNCHPCMLSSAQLMNTLIHAHLYTTSCHH